MEHDSFLGHPFTFRDSTLMPVCAPHLPSEKNQPESRGVRITRHYRTGQREEMWPGHSLCSSNTRSRSPLLDMRTLKEFQANPIESEREREKTVRSMPRH